MKRSEDRQHLELAALLDQIEGRSDYAATLHLGRCEGCQAELERVRSLGNTLRVGLDLAAPPAAARARALAIFPQRPTLAIRIREILIQASEAILAPTPGPFGMAAGVRSDGTTEIEHVRYASAGIEIDLEVSVARLSGQVIRADGPPAVTAWIERPAEPPSQESPISRDGMFHIETPPPRPFDLVIDHDDCRVRVRLTDPNRRP